MAGNSPRTRELTVAESSGAGAGLALSVILPLAHAHGDPVALLATWTEQTLDRSRYQLVIAAPRGAPRELLERTRALLVEPDLLIEVDLDRADNEIRLWNAAAAAASGPWLLVSEAHCIAARGCLEAAVRAIESAPANVAAITIGHDHSIDSAVTALGGRWIDAVGEARATRPWRPIVQIGTAIRAQAFAELGGLDERLGSFAMELLGARLHEAGLAMAHVSGHHVTHIFEPTLRGSRVMTVDFTDGECAFSSLDDPGHFERYFGFAPEWGDRMRFRPAIAGKVASALAQMLRAVPREGMRGDARWLVREQLSWLPAVLGGYVPYVLTAAAAENASALSTKLRWTSRNARYRAFVRWHAAIVRRARLQNARGAELPSVRAKDGCWHAGELDATMLVGASRLEGAGAERFRWLGPAALLRLAPQGPEGTITIDTLGLRGDAAGYLRAVFAGAARVPPNCIDGDGRFVRVKLPPELAAKARSDGIILLCRPLIPARAGSADGRRLGMPLASVEVSSG